MFNPNGLFIAVREEIGTGKWLVSILDFATWRHRKFTYDTEQAACAAALLWFI